MKSFLLTLVLSCFMLGINAQDHSWAKSTSGIWKVKSPDNKITSYKIDVDGVVWSSTDEKKWGAVDKNMWTDFEGNVYRAMNKMFFMSNDGGKTWDNTPGATWHGGDGKWYKFDESWGLWISEK